MWDDNYNVTRWRRLRVQVSKLDPKSRRCPVAAGTWIDTSWNAGETTCTRSTLSTLTRVLSRLLLGSTFSAEKQSQDHCCLMLCASHSVGCFKPQFAACAAFNFSTIYSGTQILQIMAHDTPCNKVAHLGGYWVLQQLLSVPQLTISSNLT